ncbi:MAG: undecaprenyl-diphosphate phosphatase [Proteobacteria bacterium]|nr:undecaprenyl-diphosphate phosphatase [Pseudomonadota bacterium]
MSNLQLVVLAIVQGLTEFLPISSSGHLVLVPSTFGWSDQGVAFDVAVHFGSLAAVLTYFRGDIVALLRGSRQLLGGKLATFEARLALGLGLGTVPGAIGGLLLAGWIADNLRSPRVIVATLAGFAVLMWLADRFGGKSRVLTDITLKDAMLIGLAQMMALVPGTSRSGVTITAAMALGFERTEAARFSFLLAVPVILLAAAYELTVLLLADAVVPWGQLLAGAVIAGVVAYVSIRFFMRFVNRVGLLPFVIYRLSLAAVIVYVLA